MKPSQPPTEASGTAERTVILSGRVLAEKVASPSFMGQPFEGYGLTGEEVHAFSEKGPDGKEFQSMELIYSRKK